MTNAFHYLLEELSKIFQMPLHLDHLGACSILFPQNLIVQMQLDSTETSLYLFSKLAPLPPGRFREEVLKEALKANGLQDPIPAIFCYIDQTNHLAIYQSYPLQILNGEKLAALFTSFLAVATSWKEAILKGQTHPSGFR